MGELFPSWSKIESKALDAGAGTVAVGLGVGAGVGGEVSEGACGIKGAGTVGGTGAGLAGCTHELNTNTVARTTATNQHCF